MHALIAYQISEDIFNAKLERNLLLFTGLSLVYWVEELLCYIYVMLSSEMWI